MDTEPGIRVSVPLPPSSGSRDATNLRISAFASTFTGSATIEAAKSSGTARKGGGDAADEGDAVRDAPRRRPDDRTAGSCSWRHARRGMSESVGPRAPAMP